MAGEAENLAVDLAKVAAPYVVVGLIAWWAWEHFFANEVAKVSTALDTGAENYGEAQSAQENGPRTEYNSARSAYAASVSWDFVSQGYSIPGWPTFEQWQNGGVGPAGFRYGDSNYPSVPEASWWGSVTSAVGAAL